MRTKYYVSYNEYGGVEARVEAQDLLTMIAVYEANGTLGRGVWEFNVTEYGFCARIAPHLDFGDKSHFVDEGWHHWRYTFVEEVV